MDRPFKAEVPPAGDTPPDELATSDPMPEAESAPADTIRMSLGADRLTGHDFAYAEALAKARAASARILDEFAKVQSIRPLDTRPV